MIAISGGCQMPSLTQINVAPALTFDALVAGEPGAPLVLLLHGFAESMNCWRAQATALADMGYRAIAPSQRGYSKDARPDPRDVSHYHIDRLMDDAMAIVASSGYGADRFHLAGHDWGGSIAWALADRYPERIASLTILMRPTSCSPMMPDGCAIGGPPTVCRRPRSRTILPCWAIKRRWKRRSPGIAHAARSALRLARSMCRHSTSGGMPTTPSAASPQRARAISSPRPIASRCCPASATSPPIRRPIASAS